MYIGIPQLILVLLLVFGMFTAIVKHGESKGTHHMGISFIALVIEVALLYWGGFFG